MSAEAYPGSQVKLYIETRDGQLREITGFVSEFSVTVEDSSQITTDLRIIGYDPVTFSSADRIAARIQQFNSAGEWKCDYCGHINPKSARNCGGDEMHSLGCGAARSFIYGN